MVGRLKQVVKDSWQVFGAHIAPVGAPELQSVFVRVVSGVSTAKCVAARIAEPDIVACFGSDEGRRDVWIVHDPTVGGVEHSVLHEYGGLVGRGLAEGSRDSEYCEDVAVFGCNLVGLGGKAVVRAKLSEGFSYVGVVVEGVDDVGLGHGKGCSEVGDMSLKH